MLHTIIRELLDDFLRAAADRGDGAGLPEFIAREVREFLTCGVLTHGFARVRCERCALERLVPFSCKGRGFSPSCGGRRMTERAAHVVDEVLPPVPVRQWVLTLPYRLRYLLAWDQRLSRAVLAVHARALLEFHPARSPTDAEVGQVLGTIRRRVGRLLRRRGPRSTWRSIVISWVGTVSLILAQRGGWLIRSPKLVQLPTWAAYWSIHRGRRWSHETTCAFLGAGHAVCDTGYPCVDS